MGSFFENIKAKIFSSRVPEKDDPLNDVLTNYVKSDVNYNADLMERHKQLIERVTKILEDAFQSPWARERLQGVHFQRIIKSGSAFENLKVHHPDEFDVMIVFYVNDERSWNTIVMDEESRNSGYDNIDVVRSMSDSLNATEFTQNFCNNVSHEGEILEVLSSTKFYQQIGGLMVEVLRETPMRYNPLPMIVDLHDCLNNGPAVTVTVSDDESGEEMSLDLVATLQIENADGRKLLVPKKDHWRQAYALEEKELIKQIDSSNRIFPQVLRIVKAISSKEQVTSPLSKIDSYTYKNAIFWLFLEDGSNTSLSGVFRRYLDFLRACFENARLPRYFEENRNLLDRFDKKLLKLLAGYINNIITNKYYEDFVNLNSLNFETPTNSLERVVDTAQCKARADFDDPNDVLNLKQHFQNDDVQKRLKLRFKDVSVLSVHKVALVFSLDDSAFLTTGPISDNYGFTAYRIIQGIDSLQPEVHQTYVKKGTKSLDAGKIYDTIAKEVKVALSYIENSQMDVLPAIVFEKSPHFILTPAEVSDCTLFKQIEELEIQIKVERMDAYDKGCRRRVLDILKAGLVDNPRVSLAEEICQVAVLNNADHFRCSHDKQVAYMVTRIIDYITDCLHRGFMPNAVDSEINMLSLYDNKSFEVIRVFLLSLREKDLYSIIFIDVLTIQKVDS